jgi:hypothetical protein
MRERHTLSGVQEEKLTLSTPASVVICTLDDPSCVIIASKKGIALETAELTKVQNLDGCTVDLEGARDRCQGSKIDLGYF